MEDNNGYLYKEKELTLKDIILISKEYFEEIVKSWKAIVLITLPFLCYMLYKTYNTPTTYKSTLSFMLNENEGGIGLGGAAAVLGSFIGAQEAYSLDKILELSKSQRIINESLLETEEVNGKKDFFANHIINSFNFPSEAWKKDVDLRNGIAFTHSDISKFTPREAKALKYVYYRMVGLKSEEPIFTTSFSKQSQIMKMNLNTRNEELSIKLLKVIYRRLSDFYVKKSIEKQKFTYEVIIGKVDSLKQLLSGREYARAKFDDTNRGLILETNRVKAQRLTRDVGMLQIMYAEAVKNAEVADFAIKSKVPFIQEIDMPFSPLEAVKPSLLKNILLGIFLGLVAGSLFVIIRKSLKSALQES